MRPPPKLALLLSKVNAFLGHIEHGVVFFCLVLLIFIAAGQSVARFFFDSAIPHSETLIRMMVFYIAMAGAALAAGNFRMIQMDLVSKVLAPKPRAWVRVVAAAIAVFACALLARGGYQAFLVEPKTGGLLSSKTTLLALPIGAALIGLHSFLLLTIECCYLLSGQICGQFDGSEHLVVSQEKKEDGRKTKDGE